VRQRTETQFTLLRRLTADNPRQQGRLDRLEALLGEALAAETSAIAGPQSSTRFDRPHTLASIGNEPAIHQIESLFQQIKGEETQLLRQRSIDSSSSSAVVRAVVGAGSFLGAISVLLCSLIVTRYLRRREQAEATLLQVQQGLEERVRERTSELRDLAASLQAEITDRQKTEEQLRESEQRYRLVAKASNGAIWDWDVVSGQVHWIEDAQRSFGFAAGSMIIEYAL